MAAAKKRKRHLPRKAVATDREAYAQFMRDLLEGVIVPARLFEKQEAKVLRLDFDELPGKTGKGQPMGPPGGGQGQGGGQG